MLHPHRSQLSLQAAAEDGEATVPLEVRSVEGLIDCICLFFKLQFLEEDLELPEVKEAFAIVLVEGGLDALFSTGWRLDADGLLPLEAWNQCSDLLPAGHHVRPRSSELHEETVLRELGVLCRIFFPFRQGSLGSISSSIAGTSLLIPVIATFAYEALLRRCLFMPLLNYHIFKNINSLQSTI